MGGADVGGVDGRRGEVGRDSAESQSSPSRST